MTLTWIYGEERILVRINSVHVYMYVMLHNLCFVNMGRKSGSPQCRVLLSKRAKLCLSETGIALSPGHTQLSMFHFAMGTRLKQIGDNTNWDSILEPKLIEMPDLLFGSIVAKMIFVTLVHRSL